MLFNYGYFVCNIINCLALFKPFIRLHKHLAKQYLVPTINILQNNFIRIAMFSTNTIWTIDHFFFVPFFRIRIVIKYIEVVRGQMHKNRLYYYFPYTYTNLCQLTHFGLYICCTSISKDIINIFF